MPPRLHRPDSLRALVRDMILAAGWNEAEAQETARHLVLANLSGHDSHGVGMLDPYFTSLADGHLKPQAKATIRSEAAPFLIVDGNVALGQPAAYDAVARATEMARTAGVAIVNLIDSHHIGRIGHYAEQAAEAGLISFFWVNVAGRPPFVAPFGGREARFGTNPHTIGIPVAGAEPLVLDFATSRMAHGKARVALNKGEQVPPGYLIDADGQPTQDPIHVFSELVPGMAPGALLAFGDHKGSGIAVLAEVLSTCLTGASRVDTTRHGSWILNSLFGILIDPARLEPDADARRERIDGYLAFLRATAPQDPAAPVLMPGDKERATRIQRERDGIPLDDKTWALIGAAAARVGIDTARY